MVFSWSFVPVANTMLRKAVPYLWLRRFPILQSCKQSIMTTPAACETTHKGSSNFDNVVQKFQGIVDRYNNFRVDTTTLTMSDAEFEHALQDALANWPRNGIRAIWFRLDLKQAAYIPLLVKHGFEYHHAKKDYVMMTIWLAKHEPSSFPPYPHTFIGVAGLVVNEKNQILTIQEKYHIVQHWKLPGGYAEPGEDFGMTAKREVLEETGISCDFVSLLALRHYHQHLFGCSDLYIVCHLKPLNTDIIQCKREIAKSQWMDIEEFRNHPHVSDMNRHFINKFLETRRKKVAIGLTPVLAFTKDRYVNVYNIVTENDEPESS